VSEWDKILPSIKARDRVLEIGSFEGESACWFLEHLLTDRGGLYCIDTWRGGPELTEYFGADIIENAFETFKSNVTMAKRHQQRVEILKGSSVSGLAFLLMEQQSTFDLVYVDGSHTAAATISDACMAWPLLKSGGVMVFDDYLWGFNADAEDAPLELIPKMAIDFFFVAFRPQLIPIYVGSQFAVKKK
jgi:Predicted O-methyltransferase